MRHWTRDRVVLTMVCTICLFLDNIYDDGWGHLVYCFFHANVFHFLGNMLCLWMMRFPLRFFWSYIIGVIGSLLPCPVLVFGEGLVYVPSCGLSGVLMASIGLVWGDLVLKDGWGRGVSLGLRYVILPILITGLLPNVNFMIHLWCFLIGLFGEYVYVRWIYLR